MNEYKAMVEWYLQGKTSPIATSSIPNSTWTDVVSNPGLQSERPVTNHLSPVEVPLTLTTEPHVEVPLTLATQPAHTTLGPQYVAEFL